MSSLFLRAPARLRWALARHRRAALLLLALPAVTAGLIVQQQVAATNRTQRLWGERREVLVSRRAVAAGELIGPADVRRVEVPAVAVGPDPVTALDATMAARHPLAAGEQLLAHHFGRPDVGELPPGHVGVAVPLAPGASLPVIPGSRVDVFIGGDPLAVGAPLLDEAGLVDLVITTVVDGIAVVAVPEADAERIAVAASLGRVTLAWRSGSLAATAAPSPPA